MSISSLPPEILRIIFSEVAAIGLKDLYRLAAVSRLYYSIYTLDEGRLHRIVLRHYADYHWKHAIQLACRARESQRLESADREDEIFNETLDVFLLKEALKIHTRIVQLATHLFNLALINREIIASPRYSDYPTLHLPISPQKVCIAYEYALFGLSLDGVQDQQQTYQEAFEENYGVSTLDGNWANLVLQLYEAIKSSTSYAISKDLNLHNLSFRRKMQRAPFSGHFARFVIRSGSWEFLGRWIGAWEKNSKWWNVDAGGHRDGWYGWEKSRREIRLEMYSEWESKMEAQRAGR